MKEITEEKILFLNKSKYFIAFSALIIIAGIIVGIICGGLNLGVDFTGGSILTIDLGGQFDGETINRALEANGLNAETTQVVAADNGTQAIIRIPLSNNGVDPAAVREGIIKSIKESYPDAEAGNIESVGGVTTGEIVKNAFLAVIIASVFILLYIWIRFTFYPGIAGVVALLHDILIMTAFVSIFQIPVNSSYIAACLTIVGYSINDTIVVFDRIRENNKKYNLKSTPRLKVADYSIRETLPRTINTFITSLIMAVSVYIFGVTSIREFSLPLIVGLISGFYSSIFIATPIWVGLANAKANKGKKKMVAKAKA